MTKNKKPVSKWKELEEYRRKSSTLEHARLTNILQQNEIERQERLRRGKLDPHSCPGCEA